MDYSLPHIAAHFGRAAAHYDAVAGLQQRHIALAVEALEGRLPAQARMADIGCGTGGFARLVQQRGLMWQIAGLDLAAPMCQRARAEGIGVMQGDMHHLPVASGAVEAALCAFAMQWSPQPQQVMAELARITLAGGYVAVLTFTCGTLAELAQACADAGISPRSNAFFTLADYELWGAAAGLQPVQVRETLHQHYYTTPQELFKQLKCMGATHAGKSGGRGLGERRVPAAISAAYTARYAMDGRIPASWNVGWLLLQKI